MKKYFTLLAALITLLLLPFPKAQAHAQITGTFPKNSAVLADMPLEVWFEFDGNLTEIDGTEVNFVSLKDKSGRELAIQPSRVAGARIIAKIKDNSSSGEMRATYRVVSEDGHPVEGFITFSIQERQLVSSKPSVSKKKDATQANSSIQPSASQSSVAIPAVSKKPAILNVHSNHNFAQRHAHHFIEFAGSFALVGIWFLYERRRKK